MSYLSDFVAPNGLLSVINQPEWLFTCRPLVQHNPEIEQTTQMCMTSHSAQVCSTSRLHCRLLPLFLSSHVKKIFSLNSYSPLGLLKSSSDYSHFQSLTQIRGNCLEKSALKEAEVFLNCFLDRVQQMTGWRNDWSLIQEKCFGLKMWVYFKLIAYAVTISCLCCQTSYLWQRERRLIFYAQRKYYNIYVIKQKKARRIC